MASYTYTARDAKGALKSATVDAPSREAAVPKLIRVRVEFSKKASAIVFPRSVASFFSGWRWIS